MIKSALMQPAETWKVVFPDTIRELLNGQLGKRQLRDYEEESNQALASRLPWQLRERTIDTAIDGHDEPFLWQDT